MPKKLDKKTLSVIKTIDAVLLNELNHIIYPSEDVKNLSAYQPDRYIKFQLIATNIEFLGACYDELPFYYTRKDKEKIVEKRFNTALKKLFGKKYNQYAKDNAKKNSPYYLYRGFRCCMIHQLRPGPRIFLTTRKEAKKAGHEHLVVKSKGRLKGNLILVLEDFYDDFRKAAERLKRGFEDGSITNKKGTDDFLRIEGATDVITRDGNIPAVTGSAKAETVKLSEEGDGDEEKGNSDEIDEGLRFIRVCPYK